MSFETHVNTGSAHRTLLAGRLWKPKFHFTITLGGKGRNTQIKKTVVVKTNSTSNYRTVAYLIFFYLFNLHYQSHVIS